MAILQALFAFIGRSAGKILNAIFGWAVRALFGNTTGTEQAVLTGVVALAALWPLLLIGIVAPRGAALLLAFVPIPEGVPDWTIRAVWIGLAVAIPAGVGIALATKRPPGAPAESVLTRVGRGYPTTLGLAAAFWMSALIVPVAKISSIVRGRQDTHVPLVTDADGYQDTATRVHRILDAHGFELHAREPAFWVRAPMTPLRKLGGAAFRHYIPERMAHFVGPTIEVALYPNSLLLRGQQARVAYAHGLVVEGLTPASAFQTTVPEAQDIERQIRDVWQALARNPSAHVRSPWLRSRLDDIVGEISQLETSYDEWQIVYRQALQLGRALDGEPQLLARDDEQGGLLMEHTHEGNAGRGSAWRQRSTMELVREVASKAGVLVGKEIELARTELKNDFASELATVKGFGVAAVAGLLCLNMLLVAAVFALTPYVQGWVAALAIAGVMLLVAAIAGVIGWRHHVAKPLDRTQKTLKEDVRWAKQELA